MTVKPKRIVLAGGGTGGHVIPAIAIADEISRRGGEVRFVGTRGRIEEKLVPQAGYGIDFIDVKPITGGGVAHKAKGVMSVPLSVMKSMSFLRGINPDAVVGVGGYVSGPVVLGARLMGKKTAFLEQNATLGLANKLLKNVVHRAFVSYESTGSELNPKKTVFTGNPVKPSIIEAARHRKRAKHKPINILVMGGSQGAGSVDSRVPQAMALAKLGGEVKVVHQGQSSNLEIIAKNYADAGIEAEVTAFIDDTAMAFSDADFVVARSGATTVAELTVMGLCAVFLPYPHHKDEQQKKNARGMEKKNAAILLDEKKTGVEELAEAIRIYACDEDKRLAACAGSLELGCPNAARDIVDSIYEMIP